MIALQAVRSLLFYALFLGQTMVLAILLGTVALITRGRRTAFSWAIGQYWGNSNLFLLRWIVGIRTSVTGGDNIPAGPCIIAAKHQSDWDIFAILPHTRRPAFIAKKELMRIPFFGWAAASIDAIEIDRGLGSRAIPAMIESARVALARGCQIIIFPEGTRRLPLAEPDYRQGVVRMYEGLGVPVVPVALNSGVVWSRNSLVLWPGIARARILPAIPPGLDPKTFKERLVAAIETESDALILRAVTDGLARPVPQEWRSKLDAIKTGVAVPAAERPTTY